MMNWDTYFLNMVDLVSTKSESRGKKVGCVLVGPDHEVRSTGYNGLPRGVIDDDVKHIKPYRYLFMEHAERNAIYNAARCGIPLKGCTSYQGYYSCADCARGLIQVGIERIVFRINESIDWKNWQKSIDTGLVMLQEAGVIIEKVV